VPLIVALKCDRAVETVREYVIADANVTNGLDELLIIAFKSFGVLLL